MPALEKARLSGGTRKNPEDACAEFRLEYYSSSSKIQASSSLHQMLAFLLRWIFFGQVDKPAGRRSVLGAEAAGRRAVTATREVPLVRAVVDARGRGGWYQPRHAVYLNSLPPGANRLTVCWWMGEVSP